MLKEIFNKARALKDNAIVAIKSKSAETYVDTGVKVLIAVVIGALILTLCYSLIEDEIMNPLIEAFGEAFENI